MSEREEQDFLKDYLNWMKGPGLDLESLTVYNFGYERPRLVVSLLVLRCVVVA